MAATLLMSASFFRAFTERFFDKSVDPTPRRVSSKSWWLPLSPRLELYFSHSERSLTLKEWEYEPDTHGKMLMTAILAIQVVLGISHWIGAATIY